uniref:Uncharacterized protein n=1 Tax=Anguilla anguilla TaxID=7936 RepID=A0A0E9PRP7_ANGAN
MSKAANKISNSPKDENAAWNYFYFVIRLVLLMLTR